VTLYLLATDSNGTVSSGLGYQLMEASAGGSLDAMPEGDFYLRIHTDLQTIAGIP
jgi:hypothetical protein